MKKMFYIIPIALLMGACSGEANDTNEAAELEATTTETMENETQEEPAEVVTDRTAQQTFVESILGKWSCDAATAGVQIDLNIKDDGSILQKLGPKEEMHRYIALDGDRMQIINDKGEAFQTWEVKNITENSIDICWNPDAEKPKTIPYQRKL